MWPLFGLSLSLAIEGGQYLSGRRVTDVDDLILNTLGTLLGYRLAQRRGEYEQGRSVAADSQ